MHLIDLGPRRLNLEFLIMDEENDGTPDTADIPPGAVRVTMARGRELVLVGEQAAIYRRCVKRAVEPDPEIVPGSASMATAIDPATGAPLPFTPDERKEGG